MDEVKTQTNEQQEHVTPTDKGGQKSERLFTQEELNKIVAERLSREREKSSGASEAMEQLKHELNDRESTLSEREQAIGARSQEFDAREAEIQAKLAEIQTKELHEAKIKHLTEKYHFLPDKAAVLADLIKVDSMDEFIDKAFIASHAFEAYREGPGEVSPLQPETPDNILRKAFGLRRR